MSFNFQGAGLFSTWGMQSGDLPADELAARAAKTGVSWVAGQYDDGPNDQNLLELAACTAGSVVFGIWDAAPDPYRLDRLLQLGPVFVIFQAEGNQVDWPALLGRIPHTMPRGVVTNFAGLDDAALHNAGAACLPECYLPENPNADPDGMCEEAKRRGYDLVVPCLGVYWDYPLAAYQTTQDFAVWAAETMTDADWSELACRTANGGDPVPDDDWWEHAYKGGPMVAVKGFPRPLYPPDADKYGKGKGSVDGPDVEAYKRTVSRAGRWVWQAFDQAFSNGFSHGKGPDVTDTGVAGVQRQQGFDDPGGKGATGWVGQDTFNTLRSIRVPDGKTHAGEMCMDARSVELINAAWDRFKGKEPAHGGSSSSAQARLKKAQAEVGQKESPANSNQQKYGSWYGMNGVPWCAIFCTWADQLGAAPAKSFAKGSRYSYVPYVVSDARLCLNGLSVVSTPKPGDLCCYDWASDGEYDHIGIVKTAPDSAGQFTAIEGNTSTSDNSNGGQVMQRTRNRYSQATVFVRVSEP